MEFIYVEVEVRNLGLRGADKGFPSGLPLPEMFRSGKAPRPRKTLHIVIPTRMNPEQTVL
jgi:hypothetical protein